MGSPVKPRIDYSSARLRQLAKHSKESKQSADCCRWRLLWPA